MTQPDSSMTRSLELGLSTVGGSTRQRLYIALRQGVTLSAAASMAGVSQSLAEVMLDEMRRQGVLERAESLCASGLGACGGGTSDEVKIHCAGCPIQNDKVTAC